MVKMQASEKDFVTRQLKRLADNGLLLPNQGFLCFTIDLYLKHPVQGSPPPPSLHVRLFVLYHCPRQGKQIDVVTSLIWLLCSEILLFITTC